MIYEAALRSGAGDALTNTLGRPGCAVLPLAINTGVAALSFGCKGNRTFTGLPDNEMYQAIPGDKWETVLAAVSDIIAANTKMERYYLDHRTSLAGST